MRYQTLGEVLDESGDSSLCPEVFAGLRVLFYAFWSDYEESGYSVIFEFFDELMLQEGGYCVMADDNTPVFDPVSITLEEAQDEVSRWIARDPNEVIVNLIPSA